MRKIRRQRPVKGGRRPLPACVINEIEVAVMRDAYKYRASKSWVIASLLAAYYKIKIPMYDE